MEDIASVDVIKFYRSQVVLLQDENIAAIKFYRLQVVKVMGSEKIIFLLLYI